MSKAGKRLIESAQTERDGWARILKEQTERNRWRVRPRQKSVALSNMTQAERNDLADVLERELGLI